MFSKYLQMDFLYVALAFIQTFMKTSILFQKQADHIFKICHTLQWLPVVPKTLILIISLVYCQRLYTYFVEDKDLSPSPMAKLEKSGSSISPQEPSLWDRASAAISGTVTLVCSPTTPASFRFIWSCIHWYNAMNAIQCWSVCCQVRQLWSKNASLPDTTPSPHITSSFLLTHHL